MAKVIWSALNIIKGKVRGEGMKLGTKEVCQIGHPVLRRIAKPVSRDKIPTPEFQKLLDHMIRIMRENKAVGLAAPQVGVGLQVFCMELSDLHHKLIGAERFVKLQMSILPLTILINPHLTVTNDTPVTHEEGCVSMGGYVGRVARATGVQIDGLNRHGDEEQHNLTDWTARIAQHEYDHLQGVIYIDKMEGGSLRSMLCTEHKGVDWKLIESLKQQNIL